MPCVNMVIRPIAEVISKQTCSYRTNVQNCRFIISCSHLISENQDGYSKFFDSKLGELLKK